MRTSFIEIINTRKKQQRAKKSHKRARDEIIFVTHSIKKYLSHLLFALALA